MSDNERIEAAAQRHAALRREHRAVSRRVKEIERQETADVLLGRVPSDLVKNAVSLLDLAIELLQLARDIEQGTQDIAGGVFTNVHSSSSSVGASVDAGCGSSKPTEEEPWRFDPSASPEQMRESWMQAGLMFGNPAAELAYVEKLRKEAQRDGRGEVAR